MTNEEDKQTNRDPLNIEYQECVTHSRFVVSTRFSYFMSFTTFFFVLIGGFHYVWTAEESVFGKLKPWIMLVVSAFGFYMVGIVLILERRAAQLYRAADKRAADIEKLMGIQNGIRQIFIMSNQRKKFFGIPLTHTAGIAMFYGAVALIWLALIFFSVCDILF